MREPTSIICLIINHSTRQLTKDKSLLLYRKIFVPSLEFNNLKLNIVFFPFKTRLERQGSVYS